MADPVRIYFLGGLGDIFGFGDVFGGGQRRRGGRGKEQAERKSLHGSLPLGAADPALRARF